MRQTALCVAFTAATALGFASATRAQTPPPEKGPMRLRVPVDVEYRFGGLLGARIDANLRQWLLPAPEANPGLTAMFRLRDREPAPKLVDWAGEFVGKYLISAVQARRMVESPELDRVIRQVTDEVIAAQAEDGYLGPFRKEERLLGHWDLWGHYHVMQALLMMAEELGDKRARQAAIRAADLICGTYLDGTRRVFDAGSAEMNMAVIHVFGRLYRLTGRERYLRMMEHIEADWQRAGDYLRAGAAGVDFHRTPRPRWESLHDLQGLIEIWRITGREESHAAFTRLWTSIRRYDRHNSGSFSTGEGAVGSPYRPGAIETCCTTAWMAVTVDMLQLTADATAADELELAAYNAVPASQHPSGRWWTYDTPMDGRREASAHSIVFQARPGAPELNCCSVNGPRGLGMLSEWAVLEDAQGPVISHYGPSTATLTLASGVRLTLVQLTDYPADGHVRLTVQPDRPAEFDLRLRIPAWSARTNLRLNAEAMPVLKPGTYHSIRRRWERGDAIDLDFDMSPRYWAGQQETAGKASLYHGPVLLAFDQRHNGYDCSSIPRIDVRKIDLKPGPRADERFPPLVLFDLASEEGRTMRLCDFATAGAHGTEYRSWLPAIGALPPAFDLNHPPPDAKVAPGALRFAWVGFPSRGADGTRYDLHVARDAAFTQPVAVAESLVRTGHRLSETPGAGTYHWKVIARNSAGATVNRGGPRAFTIDPGLPNSAPPLPETFGEERIVASSQRNGSGAYLHAQPTVENVEVAPGRGDVPGRAQRFNGRDSRLQFALAAFPEEDYTFCAWICVSAFSTKAYQQVFSAWARPMDDPLRVCIRGQAVEARIEAGTTYATPAAAIETGRWVHVAAVKEGAELRLYVDGRQAGTAAVPEVIESATRSFAVGANPHFEGDEYFDGRVESFSFHAKALTDERIRELARPGRD